MKTENTPEAKARFFALYYGQGVCNVGEVTPSLLKRVQRLPEQCREHLELTPLSQISDEDAIKVIKLHEGHIPRNLKSRIKESDSVFSPKIWKQYYYVDSNGYENVIANFSVGSDPVSVYNGNSYWRCHVRSSKYLESRGYYVGDGTEIEYGWVKLSNQTNPDPAR